ncbi:bifunctional AdoMet-dependent rRNA methyltransferase Spb1-like/S-adenosyl-L-methionine-dependent methyltransferase superfamily/Ribosomal RNA large subunit methyltransferase E/Ribosomal RNA methyltransferase [Babesia duncani]|uniref:Putative rRNA methyltransferase n=1 Tax=Babesia duncani TaxID=323732 RepID=A0AAD9PKX2_9APIC|nr:bifunctional AdoMet-dependent rRNA methyltransferase Spb1-like/S-adenosyl-L-methionine-dependent methyltransferase superfamily/Ribosomal RNA large subunit methyltransferase E/Ribosomal RNA methyltransferase [Babesia duncani]
MDRKHKLGKDRLDKYYHLAKEQGYRSRSAFKILQLSKKFNFFDECRVLVDLCAAPGGWLQVAVKHMPVSSTIIGVDLVPIKPIKGVTTIQADIRTQKCHSMIMRHLNGANADVVLHDGAPNMGCNWNLDAFNQNVLVLESVKLAAHVLRKGGTFVTKIFRSADYNSMIWMLSQCFERTKVTKPQSSRNVSAEVFAICIGFKGLKGLDPKLFNCDFVFQSNRIEEEPAVNKGVSLVQLLKQNKKRNKEGYDEGDDFRECGVLDFFNSSTPAPMLLSHNRFKITPADDPIVERILSDSRTTQEIKLLCSDLKVAGKGDLMSLLRWRQKLRKDMSDVFQKEHKIVAEPDATVETVDEVEELQVEENTLTQRQRADQRRLERKQRKLLKKHQKAKCDTAVPVAQDIELFDIQKFSGINLDDIGTESESDVDSENEEDLESLVWESDIDEDVKNAIKMDADLEVQHALHKMESSEKPKNKLTRRQRVKMERGAEINSLLNDMQYEARLHAQNVDEESDDDEVPTSQVEVDRWFDQGIFKDLDMIDSKAPNKGNKLGINNKYMGKNSIDDKDDKNMGEDSSEIKVVPAIAEADLQEMQEDLGFDDLKTKDGIESVQAIGSLLVRKKTRMALIDGSVNSRTFDDVQELPSWFIEDEKRHSNYELPVTKELMKKYKKKLLEIKNRPIRKVQEAQARKKMRMQRKLRAVLPRMDALANEDGNSSALRSLARKLKNTRSNKRDKVYVVSRKSGNSSSSTRSVSKGSRKKVKLVDSRMKKDKRVSKKTRHFRKAKLH